MALNLLSAASANAACSAICTPGTTYYAGLCDGSPGTTGANEVTGGSYARQATIFGSPSSGIQVTTDAQNWTGMPATTITHFFVNTAATSGTYIAGGALSSSLTIPAGTTVVAAVGALSLAVQG